MEDRPRNKIYIISGMGADRYVLRHLSFPDNTEPVHIDWLMPEKKESLESYVRRMAADIDTTEPFFLLGYSFGGVIVQEIDKIKPAEKVVIIGSIKSDKEQSRLMKWGRLSRIPHLLPRFFYSEKMMLFSQGLLRRQFTTKGGKLMEYFRVRDPDYLKWAVMRILDWKGNPDSNAIQILADRDLIFPIGNSRPDYTIQGASHLFPATRAKELSAILANIFG
ncbi:MAG: alpha/beta hydrolase [Chryseobacterium sp.]|nr:MAG: alpha/beta hydrolase [Chryseobacterium sp.]